MKRLVLALLAATALSTPALAQTKNSEDYEFGTHMRVWDYQPNIRYRIINTVGRSTAIQYASDEQIVRIVFGDAGATWEGPDPEEAQRAPMRNTVVLAPIKRGYTSIQVITRSAIKGDRIYQYAAVSRELPEECSTKEECDDPESIYGITYNYPQDEEAKKREAAKAEAERKRLQYEAEAPLREMRAQQVKAEAATARLRTEPFMGGACRNVHYDAVANEAGRRMLIPDAVSDNGQETHIRFNGNRETPVFLSVQRDEKGKPVETPIQPTLSGISGVSILPGVYQTIRLRIGEPRNAVVELRNKKYNPAGCNPGTGTTSTTVARNLRRQVAAPARPRTP
jgi:type IV secretion system protein VirB9